MTNFDSQPGVRLPGEPATVRLKPDTTEMTMVRLKPDTRGPAEAGHYEVRLKPDTIDGPAEAGHYLADQVRLKPDITYDRRATVDVSRRGSAAPSGWA